MLFNIHTLSWDEELCALLDIPMNILPRPVSNSEVYGTVAEGIEGLEELAGVPICGAAGDQQAALFGQGCFTRGQAKNTYGTGCFTLMNVGGAPVRSRAGLVTTVGWSLNGETTYALEGSVFNGGLGHSMAARRAASHFDFARSAQHSAQNPFPTAAAFTWCPRSRASARRIGICMRAAASWASRAARRRRTSPAQCSNPSPIRSPT